MKTWMKILMFLALEVMGLFFEDGGSLRSGLHPFIYRVVRGVDYSNILAEFN